jgi:hypothetical protein
MHSNGDRVGSVRVTFGGQVREATLVKSGDRPGHYACSFDPPLESGASKISTDEPTVPVPAELLERLERWLDQALQAFEGDDQPSEIEGKRIHADLLELTNRAGIT